MVIIDSLLTIPSHFAVLPTKNHHNASKTSGRQPSGKFKHASVKKANSPQRVNSNNGKTPSPTKSTLVQSPPPQSPKHDIQDTVREEDETQEVAEADEPESESDLTVSEKGTQVNIVQCIILQHL